MPSHLQPTHILELLRSEEMRDTIRELYSLGHLPENNERTLQAYIWSFLLERTSLRKLGDDSNYFHPDWIIYVELYGGRGDYPDLSFRRASEIDSDRLFGIEIKHHPETFELSADEIKKLEKDVDSINDGPCDGALILTCPVEGVYTETIQSLSERAAEGTHIVEIGCV